MNSEGNQCTRKYTTKLCDAMLPVMIDAFWEIWLEAKMKAKGSACTSNTKQLQLGFNLYTGDFADKVPKNINPLAPTYADSTSWMGATEFGSANPSPIYPSPDYPITNGTLFTYAPSPALFRCPAKIFGAWEPMRVPLRDVALWRRASHVWYIRRG